MGEHAQRMVFTTICTQRAHTIPRTGVKRCRTVTAITNWTMSKLDGSSFLVAPIIWTTDDVSGLTQATRWTWFACDVIDLFLIVIPCEVAVFHVVFSDTRIALCHHVRNASFVEILTSFVLDDVVPTGKRNKFL